MTWLRVRWHQSDPDMPVVIWCELDDQRWESRKIEVYADGRRGWAFGEVETGGTGLGEAPIPPTEEIARDAQFEVEAISAAEFEREWTSTVER